LFHRPAAAAAIAAATFWSGDIARAETSSGFGPGGQQSGEGRRRGWRRGEDVSERQQERRKGAGGTRKGMQTAALRQTKRHQAPGQEASGAGAHAARERPSRLLRAAHPPPARPRTSAQRPRKCGGRGGLQSAVMTGRETCFDSP
jgi:hypothetical protein